MINKLNELAELLLPGVVPYWVFKSQNPPMWFGGGGATGQNLDVALRPWLEDRGCWRGRSPAVLIDDAGLAGALSWPDHRSFAWQEQVATAEHTMAGVAVHELAHVLDNGIDLVEVTASRAQIELAVARFQAATAAEPLPDIDLHTPSWLRIAAHAHQRLLQAGLGIEPERIWPGYNGTPPLANAILALGHELTELAGEPLADLAQHPYPADYVGLWRFKLDQWRKTRPDNDQAADRLVAEQLANLERN